VYNLACTKSLADSSSARPLPLQVQLRRCPRPPVGGALRVGAGEHVRTGRRGRGKTVCPFNRKKRTLLDCTGKLQTGVR
jgi:hypothetical protein